MKGIFIICFKEMIKNKHGQDKWEMILEKAGLRKDTCLLPISDIEDETALHIIDSVGEVLDISRKQVTEEFGEYWINDYAPKIYSAYYENIKTAKEFFLKLDYIHTTITRKIPNAHPPRFDYEWSDEATLIISYKSKRDLYDFFFGLTKGIRTYFKEDFKIMRMENNQIKIIFTN